ncbi:MAG TPA: TolC family outer membrane protein [Burkholderiaceae bacterium]|jgi:outer membrane protein|nr:TolC family outer membrane protein [Burkholderiaceae bacterium]
MSRRTLPLLPTALAVSLLLALPVRAQSLQELYDAARAYDASYLASRALADSSQYRLEQTRALNRPSVSAVGTLTRNETDPPPSATNPDGSRIGATTSALTLSGRQPLFNRSNSTTIDQAERTFEIAKADLQIAEQDLIVRVAQAYFDVLVAKDALAATQANKQAAGEQLASAKRNFEVGTATITDTREAQARFDLGTAQEIAADNDLRAKRIALDVLVGRTNVEPRPLAIPVALPAVAPTNVEDWVGPSQTGHPSVRKAQLGMEIARLETEKARAGHLPTVDAVGSLGSSHASYNRLGVNGTTSNASIGVQVNVPIFSGYSVQNRIKETLVLEEKSRNDLEAARRSVAQGTRVAFFGVQSGQAQAKALEAAEASGKLALEATQLGYRVGVRVNLDVLNAQRDLYSTQRDLSKARYDSLLATLRLRQAAGTLQPSDIASVNTLLAR